jgi:hypothetical protein
MIFVWPGGRGYRDAGAPVIGGLSPGHDSALIIRWLAPADWYPLFPNPVVAESLLDGRQLAHLVGSPWGREVCGYGWVAGLARCGVLLVVMSVWGVVAARSWSSSSR